MVWANVSQETRAMTHDGEDQSRCHSPIKTLQLRVAGGSQQSLLLNRNAER